MSKILNMLMAFVMSFGISGSNVNPSDIPENSNFEVHFIDVGQADSALIECDGETMMIDGGNVADSNVVRKKMLRSLIMLCVLMLLRTMSAVCRVRCR